VGIASVTLLTTGVGWVRQVLDNAPVLGDVTQSTFLEKVGKAVVAVGVALSLNVGMFWIGVPPIARKRLPVVPGAVLTTIVQGALGYGYSFYIGKAGDGGAYQGALAVIGVTLTALYLLSCAILIGAELNRFLGARKGVCVAVAPDPHHPPSRLQHEPAGRARDPHPAGH
jgi:membrane protein